MIFNRFACPKNSNLRAISKLLRVSKFAESALCLPDNSHENGGCVEFSGTPRFRCNGWKDAETLASTGVCLLFALRHLETIRRARIG